MSNVTRTVSFDISELGPETWGRIGGGHISVTLWANGESDVELQHCDEPEGIEFADWRNAVENAAHNLVSELTSQPFSGSFDIVFGKRLFTVKRNTAIGVSQVGPQTPALVAFAQN